MHTKYVGLPYMADPCHAEDTVFFVAEGDFRFYREDAMRESTIMDEACTLNRLGRMLALTATPGDGLWTAPEDPEPGHEPVALTGSGRPCCPGGSSSSSSAAVPSALGEPVAPGGGGIEGDVFAYASPRKVAPEEFLDVSPELVDLVAYMTEADNHGRGNLVWFGWNASPTGSDNPKRSCSIANGSQLIAITAKGARWMLPKLEASPACLLVQSAAACVAIRSLYSSVRASFLCLLVVRCIVSSSRPRTPRRASP